MFQGADKLLAAEAFERGRVAVAHAGVNGFMHLAQHIARRRVDHHAAAYPTHELFKAVHAVGFHLALDLFQADQVGVEHHADVGQVVLVVRRHLVIPGAVQLLIVALKGGPVKGVAQHRVHGAEDAGQTGAVNGLVVAALGSQRRFVDVDDNGGAFVEVKALPAQLAQPFGHQAPAVGGVHVFGVRAEGGRLLGAFGADKARTLPAGKLADVFEGLAVVEQRVAQEEQFADPCFDSTDALNFVEEVSRGLGIGCILFARDQLGGQFHVQISRLQPAQALVQRFQIAIDDPVLTKIGQPSPAKANISRGLLRS